LSIIDDSALKEIGLQVMNAKIEEFTQSLMAEKKVNEVQGKANGWLKNTTIGAVILLGFGCLPNVNILGLVESGIKIYGMVTGNGNNCTCVK
jgi:hypothetical protein